MTPLAHLGHFAAFAVAVAAVGTSSLAGVRALGITGHVRSVLAWGLIAGAQMVAAVEVLSLLHAVAVPGLLAIHLGVAIAVLARRGRPAPLPLPAAARALWRTADDPLLRILVMAFGVAAALLLLLVLYVPPNNHDSMTYHMTRVAAYLQQESLDAYVTPDLRQTVFPANAEILILWQAVLLRHDTTAGLVQWLCWLGSMIAVFGLARDLGFGPRSSLFAAFGFGALPVVVLQATSTQNDLAMAFFVLCAFLFAGAAPTGRRGGTLVLAAIALGLAVGTKPPAFFFAPGLAGFVLVRWAWRRESRTQVVRLAVLSALSVALLGSYLYVQNLRRFGRPTGPWAMYELVSLPHPDVRVAWSNVARLAVRLVDPSGAVRPDTPAALALDRVRVRAQDSLLRLLRAPRVLPADDFMKLGWLDFSGLPVNEDLTAFGPLYGLLGLPLLAVAILRPRSTPAVRVLAATSGSYLLAVAVLLRYQHHHARLLIAMVAVGAPLLALLYGERAGRPRAIANGLLVAVTLATLACCVVFNARKPLAGPAPVWQGLDRTQRMALGRPDLDLVLDVLDRLPPGSLGVVPAGVEDMNYPLFGEHFERRVVFVHAGQLDPLRADTLPPVDDLLVWSDRQTFLVAGAPLPTPWPWFDSRDLRPLLADLRRPGSTWHPVMDGVAPMLFTTRLTPTAGALAAFDHLQFDPPTWGDGWMPPRFRVPIRLDAARPNLLVTGTAVPDGGRTALEIAGPDGETLLRVEPPVGDFVLRVPLGSLLARGRDGFVPLEFRASTSFNPKRQGRWSDDRDLSWRLTSLRLEATPPER